jgi:hypothetical protein
MYLFLYRNGLRLRIDFRDFDSFGWWFDDADLSVLVLKICGNRITDLLGLSP